VVLSEGRAEEAAPGDTTTALVSLQNTLCLLLCRSVHFFLFYCSFFPMCFLTMRNTPNFLGVTWGRDP